MTLVAATAAALLACAGAADGRSGDSFSASRLEVATTTFAGTTTTGFAVELGDPQNGVIAPAAHVDVTSAPGYALDLTAAPGAKVADFGAIGSPPSGSGGLDLFLGDVDAEDAATYGADPAAQACAPGAHAAYWVAKLDSLIAGATASLPIAVDTNAQPDGSTTYTFRYCPLLPAAQATPAGMPLVTTFLTFSKIAPPATPGTYQWTSVVTPATPTLTADPTTAFELRADVPLPETLTLHARYVANEHLVVLSGRLTAVGRPRAGVIVSVTRASDLGSGGISTTTRTDGTFSAEEHVAGTEQFAASVDTTTGPCAATSTAPGGCRAESLAGVTSLSAVLVLPRKTDPRVATKPHDQSVAHHSVLTAADIPGLLPVGDAPPPCDGFAPDVHQLTETGHERSTMFLTADRGAELYTTASVFGTVAQAKADVTALSQGAGARCEANDFAGTDGHVSSVKKLVLPKVGSEVHGYRATVVGTGGPAISVDVLVVRISRVVLTLHLLSVTPPDGIERSLARKLAARAH